VAEKGLDDVSRLNEYVSHVCVLVVVVVLMNNNNNNNNNTTTRQMHTSMLTAVGHLRLSTMKEESLRTAQQREAQPKTALLSLR